jgi:hypothetical protein
VKIGKMKLHDFPMSDVMLFTAKQNFKVESAAQHKSHLRHHILKKKQGAGNCKITKLGTRDAIWCEKYKISPC